MRKGESLQLLADFSIDSDRKIYGVAHVPVIDRENELILADAVRKALPEYMKLPILHVQHTERPVGTVVKAYVDDSGDLHLFGEIKDTEDTNDIWSDIVAGKLNKFSIFGKRTEASPECALAPHQRTSPCVTKGLILYSISVVGDNAMNQETFLRVAKAFEEGGDHTPVGKYESMESCMGANADKDSPGGYCASIEHKITGKWPAEKAVTEDDLQKCAKCGVEKCSQRLEKSVSYLLQKEPRNTSQIMERLDGLEKGIAELYNMAHPVEKSEGEDDEMEDKKEEKKEEQVEKAAPEQEKEKTITEEVIVVAPPVSEPAVTLPPDLVVKADLGGYVTKAELDTFQKAHTELKKAFDEMAARVDKMEKETIEKGGNVVIIKDKFVDDNPQLANYRAIGA